ncbi:SDR family oxidoreductase [Gordonia sp. (in: high G+C Gram-positive bacteria)]|uniref:SDR family oxidoreductase n=1 Tax=Gordonia sp. (in: high G+C Gram-positive bacteria) TaxID=84139 RepID=UPI003C722454
MRVTVVGASGQFGSLVCDGLEKAGVEVTRAHRGTGVDAVTGDGLAAACDGADIIVDATSTMERSAAKSRAFFGTVARHISKVARESGSQVVYLTIYGASDPVVNEKMGHYQGKAEQERVYAEQLGDNATAIASVQWYSLAEAFMSMMRVGPFAAAPHMVARPAAVEDVAKATVELILAPVKPQRLVVAGPEVMDMADVAKAIAKHRGSPKKVFAITIAKGVKTGGLVPQQPDVITATTLEDWLATR